MQIDAQVIPTSPAKSDPNRRLADFAHHLAKTHNAKPAPTASPRSWFKMPGRLAGTRGLYGDSHLPEVTLLDYLKNWELALHKANSIFQRRLPVSRAGEWMLDNFYIIKQTLVQIEEDLPVSFLSQLPALDSTSMKGQPRIFALAWEWIGYSQSQIDLTLATVFVQEYQMITPLTIGELWALPIMLRIGILERLVCAAAELTGIDAPFTFSKIPNQFASTAPSSENLIANCFLSLRLLMATNWKTFFEQTSRVEQILCEDPARIYTGMDFDTRNSYRSVIEKLARYSSFSEEAVTLAAIKLAQSKIDPGFSLEQPTQGIPPRREAHVGYFLRDNGLAELEKRLFYQPKLIDRVRSMLLASPTATYLGSIATFSMLFILGILSYAQVSGGSPVQLIITGLLGFGLAVEAAIALVHWNITHRIKPQSLPRMDFSQGIPPGNRTMVVVPTLLESEAELNHLLQELELYYLSNPDPQLTYALLTDFGDASAERMPEDEGLLALASVGIKNLNLKYPNSKEDLQARITGKIIHGGGPFYLFHRPRQWNPSEGVWMGWERKRGKLADFNRLLLNLGETAYTTQVGNASILSEIKYVITLDADTSLPQGSASRLIATLAHPLNHAVFGANGHSVVAGYTVLQPRVSIKPTSANRSLFSQIFAGNAGFDLYSFAVSDVYQDLFGEGSYVGKGIYDVAAFERSLAGQVRQNTLLSHDLFEGIYGRAALVTDIVLYEEYPARYLVYAQRLRRWIRGDWQLLPWLLPLVRTKNGWAPNRLSTINIWKIADNLRRSLLPPTLLALLAAGWLYLPGSPLVWTMLVLLPSALPIAVHTFGQGRYSHGRQTLKQLLKPVRLQLIRWALAVLFLPYEALLMMGAIRITLARLFIARKRLLQWTTAANASRVVSSNAQYETWIEMAPAVLFTTLLGVSIAIFTPNALWVATPLLLAWLIAPQIAAYISRPVIHSITPISEPERRQVIKLARRTWAFFEQFVGPNDHWLPPDHFQESPRDIVAHYTTPTNIGLFLLSTLSAYDLGYLGISELAVRLHSTLESMNTLEHYRGHLLNWYDSQTMAALPPRYISTVDSGNLAACLIVLKQGCLGMADAPILDNKQWQGLLALLDILAESLQGLEQNNPHATIESFEVELTNIYERVSAAQNLPKVWISTITWLSGEGWTKVSYRLLELLKNHPMLSVQPDALTELQLYLDLMHHQLQDMQRSLDLFAPWLRGLEQSAELFLQTPAWQDFIESLPAELPTLSEAAAIYEKIQTALTELKGYLPTDITPNLAQNIATSMPDPAKLRLSPPGQDKAALDWCDSLEAALALAHKTVTLLSTEFRSLAAQSNTAFSAMDFRFLFDERRQVFHIGYNANTEQLDPSYYDLLASEARIASLIAIAKGDVPQSHWQHLGRPVTQVNGKLVLLSWSGTMFEYLMPGLFIKTYTDTFLADSCYSALNAQVQYGQEQQVPWGISESGYYAFDLNMNYQYQAFGVPDLGYKRDLPEDLVIAPYASMMGISMEPQAVLRNMAHLEKLNMLGRFGFYEALDYTKTHLPIGQTNARVQSYMAHHQGMILLAACNFLADDIVVQRFHTNEQIKSVELLLQEKIPQNPPIEYPHPDEPVEISLGERSVNSAPWRVPVNSPLPQTQILSQGDASLMITNAGGGFSQWREFALTRWQSDPTLDEWGTWIYVQDCESGALWSATCQPIKCASEKQDVLFYPHKVEFQRWDNGISLRTGVTISVDGVEIRRVNILNDSNIPRRLKLTSYGEVVLAAQNVDRRHPAFNKLFIESEYLQKENALVFQRRLRSDDEKSVVLVHALICESWRKVTGEHESDRARFLGRSQTVRSPAAMKIPTQRSKSLSGTTGGTLDPIFSLAQEIDLKPHAKTRVTFLTLAAPSRAEALEKLARYQTGQAIHRAFDDSRASSERKLLELGLNAYNLENIQRLYSALVYPSGVLRAAPHILAQNEQGLSGLWAFGISGDFPILLIRIRDGEAPLLTESLKAFSYWRSQHATVNIVIINDQDTGYALDLHNAILRQIRRMGTEASLNQRDGIFLLRSDQLEPANRILLETVAGVILDEKDGTLAEHASRLTIQRTNLPGFNPSISPARDPEPTSPLEIPDELLNGEFNRNGLGGFGPDGKEYIIHLRPGQHTPHPWVNVIANRGFGFLVSEAGSGNSWAENSGENRLTPWRNDPVTDMPGEALYLRDEETGLVWSPTPMPAGAQTTHTIRHGAGYSIFESQSHGLHQTLQLFAAGEAPVKIARLRLQNRWTRPRRITITYYIEWVLGTTRDAQQAYILPEFDPARHALLATNHFNGEFGERVAFLAANKKPHGVTTDRTEFLGRLGSLAKPAALGRIGLASAVNAGLDPCGAIQLHVDLAPGAEEEIFFLIGEGTNRAESLAVIDQIQAQVGSTLQAVQLHWDDILSAITVETPDSGMNLMLNRWLIYQTLSCRIWGRTALYQSSGAFGFRDQLQDVMALLHTRPNIARAQILEAACHQFDAGDVLHWWNPPAGRGVRTRFSDDLLWLPFVTAEYVAVTGDTSILLENIPFLTGKELLPDEMERYTSFETTEWTLSLYQHCRRALEKGSTSGINGLPLMGSGDWNDGMNRVGMAGQGESVWLGWFLHTTINRFVPLMTLMAEDPAPFIQQAGQLSKSLETHAWDGEWFLRAFYDDGTPLGSRQSTECQIDSIAQSWAVLSGAADPARATQAMESVNRLLVKPTEQLILLFTPPFDKTEHDPGYIKGYIPGIRENGGQYTHAAIWAAWAFARLGQGDRAWALFNMLNPISHSDTPEKTARYKVEPYVIAADIYSTAPHTGSGGWTWYTGSSGWMYRLGIESILGISRAGKTLNINPCIPQNWQGFKADYRFENTHFKISVENPRNVNRGVQLIFLDGKPLPGNPIPLLDDGQSHQIRVVMG